MGDMNAKVCSNDTFLDMWWGNRILGPVAIVVQGLWISAASIDSSMVAYYSNPKSPVRSNGFQLIYIVWAIRLVTLRSPVDLRFVFSMCCWLTAESWYRIDEHKPLLIVAKDGEHDALELQNRPKSREVQRSMPRDKTNFIIALAMFWEVSSPSIQDGSSKLVLATKSEVPWYHWK